MTGDVFVFEEEEEEEQNLAQGVGPGGGGGTNPPSPSETASPSSPPSPRGTGSEEKEEETPPPSAPPSPPSPRGTGSEEKEEETPPPSAPPSPRKPDKPTEPVVPPLVRPNATVGQQGVGNISEEVIDGGTPTTTPRPEEEAPRAPSPTPPLKPSLEEQVDQKIVTNEESSLTNDTNKNKVVNLEDQFFEILGKQTEEKMLDKMSTRGDDKNQEPTKKDKSKTYGHLNESNETSLSVALENRQTVIKRANSDYTKEGAEKNEDKIKARQEAADKACEEFSKVLQAHEKKTEPTVEGQKFKVGGRLELDMDDKNQIAFPEDLGKKVGFSASLYFADESGKPMEEDNAVYLILSYKKGKISHIQAPSGLKTAEDGRAYVERDGNKYYARVSAENIETLRKESEKARTEAINAAKAAEKEKEKAEDVVVEKQEPVAEVQSTKTAEKNDPAAMAANAPIKPRPPGLWGRVDEAKNENDNEVTQLNVTVSTQMENQIDLDDALLEAAKRGDNQVATELIEKGANVNTQAEELESKMTPLMHAASGAHVNIVNLLLTNGATRDMLDMDGNTALMWAARSTSSVRTVQALIDGKADVNMVNEKGETALMFAAANGQVEIAKALLDSRADVNAKTNDGLKTPLMHAVSKALDDKETSDPGYRGSLKAVELLVSKGADVNAKDNDGNTALTMAAAGQSVRTVEALLTGNVTLDNVNAALEVANKKKIVTALKNKQKDLRGPNIETSLERQERTEYKHEVENAFGPTAPEVTPPRTVYEIPLDDPIDENTPKSRPNSLNKRTLPPIGGGESDRGVDTKEILNLTRAQKIDFTLKAQRVQNEEARANEAEGQGIDRDYADDNKGKDMKQESQRVLNAAQSASAMQKRLSKNGSRVHNEDNLSSPPTTLRDKLIGGIRGKPNPEGRY